MNLREKLIKENKTRWLDIGSGERFDEGFLYLDILPKAKVPKKHHNNYYEKNALSLKEKDFNELSKFDFVRMQHFFEHLTYEEGQIALKNTARLLNKNGYILITTPDLRVHIEAYKKGKYKDWKGFRWWANQRIPNDSPNSFYFSIFTHGMPYEQHKWCYDIEGLKYQLEKSGLYKDIQQLKIGDKLAIEPFTHNRPEEDLCIMAKPK